ncbi:MAG: flagellar hook protein FlgE [Roseiarcus sp.]|jgi:flagellar hook protein FlgE
MSGNILNASVLGMNAQTNWLATISQNIANSSTTGYKEAETAFSSIVTQSGPGNYSAGGVSTNAISINGLQGSVTGTSTPTDLAIQGAGYFVVTDSSGDTFLTRDGSFVPDASGNLVNAAGYYLMGSNVQNGNSTIVANSLSGLQKVNVSQTGEQAAPTTSGTLSVNLPSQSTAVATDLQATRTTTAPNYTEQTSLITYNDLGAPVTLDIYMTNMGPNSAGDPVWAVDVYNHADAAAGGGFPYSAAALSSSTLTFSPTTGQLATGSPIAIQYGGGAPISLDMAASTQLATGYAVTAASTNGNAPDTLTGVSVAPDGALTFNYSSGNSLPGYDIPLANVASPDNLTSENGTVFSPNVQSGEPQVGKAGTAGFGSIVSSSLEGSTVDLATELTDMIQAQSSYEANSKVFQTGANLLSILNKLQA